MKIPIHYKMVIATAEKSAGNEQVGDMWQETSSFTPETSVKSILDWANSIGCSGKLIITVDLNGADDDF